jgi:membrane fusion protein (multidrug efflux system)
MTLWSGVLFASDISQSPPESVITGTAVCDKIHKTLEFVGGFYSLNAVTIKSEIQGIIERVHFEDGTSVTAGTPLFTLYNIEQKAKVKKAQSTLTLSMNILKRKQILAKREFLSKDELEKAQAQVEADEAELELAKEAYNKTIIRAPFNCVLSSRKISKGAFVSQGDELVNCNEIQSLQFNFQVPENQVNLLDKNQELLVETDANPGENFSGHIKTIEPIIEEKTRSAVVHAHFENKDGKLCPGFSGHAYIKTNEIHEGIIIPEEALITRQDGKYIFKVIEGMRVKLNKVTLGIRSNDKVEILTGLNKDEEIVLKGQEKLKDGSNIISVKIK